MIAREGFGIIAFAEIAAAVFLLTGWIFRSEFLFLPGVVLLVFGLFSLYFFRDPNREPPRDPSAVVSPADGRIVAVEPVSDAYVGDRAIRISIYLNLFNVHVNRSPCSGNVINCQYRPGKYLAAFDPRVAEENERTIIDIENSKFRVRFKQIAGFIARRVVNYLKPGESVCVGRRMGMIRFGSRVDVIVPEEMEISVEVREKVRAGISIIGVWNEV